MAELTMRHMVATSILDHDPTVREAIIRQLRHDLMRSAEMASVFQGEIIVGWGPIKEIRVDSLCAVRFEQCMSITPLVRCRDCKHYNAGFECLIEGYGINRPADYYCADGERKDGRRTGR